MPLNFSAQQLRLIVIQIEALNDLRQAGGPAFDGPRVLTIDNKPVAFLIWDEASGSFLAQFVDFTPANMDEVYDLTGRRIEFPYGKDPT